MLFDTLSTCHREKFLNDLQMRVFFQNRSKVSRETIVTSSFFGILLVKYFQEVQKVSQKKLFLEYYILIRMGVPQGSILGPL